MVKLLRDGDSFSVAIPLQTVKTYSVADGAESIEIRILKHDRDYYVITDHLFRGEAGRRESCAFPIDGGFTAAERAAADNIKEAHKQLARLRAHRAAHKAANPDYPGPYDGYVF